MTPNENLYVICSQPKVAGDVIPYQNVNTIEGYVVLNFKVDCRCIFRDFPNRSFCDGEVAGGSGGVNAIFSRPEVIDDVISCDDVETFQDYVCVLLWVASFSTF